MRRRLTCLIGTDERWEDADELAAGMPHPVMATLTTAKRAVTVMRVPVPACLRAGVAGAAVAAVA
jgi:hypothetical protein